MAEEDVAESVMFLIQREKISRKTNTKSYITQKIQN